MKNITETERICSCTRDGGMDGLFFLFSTLLWYTQNLHVYTMVC